MGEEFKLITERIKIGRTMEQALQETADRLGTAEFQFFVITLSIQRETGGNLAETFDTITGTIRDRIKVENKIDALTAQGFYQGVLVSVVALVAFNRSLGLIGRRTPAFTGR